MDMTALPDPLCRARSRPDLQPLHLQTRARLRFQADLGVPWQIDEDGAVFGPGALVGGRAASAVRHALELCLLRRLCPGHPAAAGLAAARTAALFMGLEQTPCGSGPALPRWADALGPAPPTPKAAAGLWAALRVHQPGAPSAWGAADQEALGRVWPLLGPAEYLMQTGGDQRLRLDPATGLNAYGCSHRPRPWAVTFASSTASSCSERGYAAAEAGRIGMLAAAFADGSGPVLAQAAGEVRRDIAAWYGLGQAAGVVLAASGTDAELLTLAVAQLHGAHRPVVAILVAPEETGSGVPHAAAGRHFAAGTAFGRTVTPGAVIDGFDPAARVVTIPARRSDGSAACPDAVAAACAAAAGQAVAAGGRALLHLLDLSKTGLLCPAPAHVADITARLGGGIDVAVDACQARLSPARVRDYLARGWMVVVTGSKFFTGPPFCGALLLPPAMLARLDGGTLPAGLGAYSARTDWPACAAARDLPEASNAGLLLRWRAALAEMEAFARVPAAARHAILDGFTTRVRRAVAAHPSLIAIAPAGPARAAVPGAEDWDSLGTIISFAIRDPVSGVPMDMAAARAVYGWLNADLSAVLPPGTGPDELSLARRPMHIGQPAPLAGPGGARYGALRLSAGARLVSGEPSLAHLAQDARVEREAADALAVLDKIALILRHLPLLRAANPAACYAPGPALPQAAAGHSLGT